MVGPHDESLSDLFIKMSSFDREGGGCVFYVEMTHSIFGVYVFRVSQNAVLIPLEPGRYLPVAVVSPEIEPGLRSPLMGFIKGSIGRPDFFIFDRGIELAGPQAIEAPGVFRFLGPEVDRDCRKD